MKALSDIRKLSQSKWRSMRLVESKPRMNHQMHMMYEVADWICYRVERVTKNMLFGKTAITFAYEIGLK